MLEQILSEEKHLCLLYGRECFTENLNTRRIREPSIEFFVCNTSGENKSDSYLYLMIQVSANSRVFTEPLQPFHMYFGLTDGVAFKPFFTIWAIVILFLFIPCI